MMKDTVFFLILALVGFTLAALTIVGSSTLLLTILRARKRRLLPVMPSALLIANLCVCDLIIGLVAGNFVAVSDVYRYQYLPVPDILDDIIRLVLGLSLFASRATIIALSWDKYIAAKNSLRYRSKMTKKRVKIFIAVIWTVSLTLCSLPLASIPEKIFDIFYAHIYASIPAILLTVLYIRVFRALGGKRRELKEAGITYAMRRKKALAEGNMVVASVIVLALFYLTALPGFVVLHLRHFCETCGRTLIFKKLEIIFSRLCLLNSALNPFLYAWRLSKYRKAFLTCFGNLNKSTLRPQIQHNRMTGITSVEHSLVSSRPRHENKCDVTRRAHREN